MAEFARVKDEANPVFSLAIRAIDATARDFWNSQTFPWQMQVSLTKWIQKLVFDGLNAPLPPPLTAILSTIDLCFQQVTWCVHELIK